MTYFKYGGNSYTEVLLALSLMCSKCYVAVKFNDTIINQYKRFEPLAL